MIFHLQISINFIEPKSVSKIRTSSRTKNPISNQEPKQSFISAQLNRLVDHPLLGYLHAVTI